MSDEQKAAYIMSQAACVIAEVLGMQAENMQREATGKSMAYTAEDFAGVVDKYGIHHNSVIGFFTGR